MRKYLNPGCSRFQVNKDLFSGKEKELIEYLSAKINTKEKRICIAHPQSSGKSDLLNLYTAYYEEGNGFDDFFEYRDEHFGRYDVIKINIKDILDKSPIDSCPVEKMYYELVDELKREYGRLKFEKDAELSDILRQIYAAYKRQFMIFIDDYDYIALNGRRYKHNLDHYASYISELMPRENDKHIALVYITGVLPVRSTLLINYLKRFKEYTIYNPNVLTDSLRKGTHSHDAGHMKFIISRNSKLTSKYLVPMICGIKVPVNLDKHLYQIVGERAALAVLSYMAVINYENHTVYLEDEKMRIYLLNCIYAEDLGKFLAMKNVFEEEYIVSKDKDRCELLNDVLMRNFSLAYKYRLPEISCFDDYALIVYYPRDEYKDKEKTKVLYIGDNFKDDDFNDAQKVVIKI